MSEIYDVIFRKLNMFASPEHITDYELISALKNIDAFKLCYLHELYDDLDFDELTFIPEIEIIHLMCDNVDFMSKIYHLSYVFDIDVFNWIELNYIHNVEMEPFDINEFIHKFKPTPETQDEYGNTLMMHWIMDVRTIPPENIRHRSDIQNVDGYTALMFWIENLPDKEAPEFLRHDPKIKNIDNKTAGMIWMENEYEVMISSMPNYLHYVGMKSYSDIICNNNELLDEITRLKSILTENEIQI